MPPIGSVIKNTLVYIIVMGISVFISVNYFLVNALVNIIDYANDKSLTDTGTSGLISLLIGLFILFVGFGLALNLSLPSIVGDEMIEF